MVFSSVSFLFYFLPIVIIAYYLLPRYRNIILLISSIFFYFYGEKGYVLILVFECVFNYLWGKIIARYPYKHTLAIGVIIDLLALLYFKYTNFFLSFFNIYSNIILPIGISFFSFQGISYLIDVYRKDIPAEKSLINFSAYLSMFPQLIAGPIVRYETIAKELHERNENVSEFALGIRRFCIGLFKKLVIANTLGELALVLSSLNEMSVIAYWLDAIFDALQIYYDFSAYSDMAIGMGLFFGFHFLENFNYPFIAKSIREFWTRWHISLSSFFKDYVYIPLGGSRVSNIKYIRNILIVWFLTGFWHGANWNFMFWGLYFAFFIILEKYCLGNILKKHPCLATLYTFLLTVFSFVIFSNTDLEALLLNVKGLFGIGVPFITPESIYYLKNYLIFLIVALLGATPLFKSCGKYFKNYPYLEIVMVIVLLVVSTGFMLDESFNPFLYFRF